MKIEKPCHENFSKMPADGDGRYCSSCRHVVTDFTKMTESEIKSFFRERQSGHACGRFYNAQLDGASARSIKLLKTRDQIISGIRFKPLRVAVIAVFLLIILGSCRGRGGKGITTAGVPVGRHEYVHPTDPSPRPQADTTKKQ